MSIIPAIVAMVGGSTVVWDRTNWLDKNQKNMAETAIAATALLQLEDRERNARDEQIMDWIINEEKAWKGPGRNLEVSSLAQEERTGEVLHVIQEVVARLVRRLEMRSGRIFKRVDRMLAKEER